MALVNTEEKRTFVPNTHFLNCTVQAKDGSTIRVGSIGLNKADAQEAKIIEYIDAHGIEEFMKKVEWNFRSSEKVVRDL